MSKDAYYFSHDYNARHDPNITAMRSVYGSEGYGWYWMLIEMMREADGYRLELEGKYTFNAYAKQMDTDCMTVERFVQDCIHEFDLFSSDGQQFWSESLIRRMEKREKTSVVRRSAANKRWENKPKNANALDNDANAMQGKERKGKEIESKVNEKEENKKSSRSSRENPFGLFETHKFGELDDITRDFIGESIDDYSEDWVIRAIKEAVLQNVHTWSYVNKILKRWKETGHSEPWTLDKPQEQKQTNVHRFPAQRPPGKPQIPVVKPSVSVPLPDEKRAEIRSVAKEIDDMFKPKVVDSG